MIKSIVWPEIACDGTLGTWASIGESITWADIQEDRRKRWTKICEAYEADRGDFYRAWRWIKEHPVFFYVRVPGEKIHEKSMVMDRGFDDGMEFTVQKVNPVSKRIEKHSPTNIQTTVWVEVFPTQLLGMCNAEPRWHDINLDTGGDTFESAIVSAADLVWTRFGNDRKTMEELWTASR